MTTLQRILVPTDFSHHALTAAELGLALAERSGGTLSLFHVNELPDFSLVAVEPMYIPPQAWERIAGQHAAEIDKHFEQVRASLAPLATGRAVIEQDYRRTGVVQGIVDAAASTKADLVVIGSAGESGPVTYLFGSTASRVSQRAPCPVLVTKPGDKGSRSAPPRRALVAVDYSRFSRPAIEAAAAVIGPDGVLDVLHVYQEPAAFALERSMRLESAPAEFSAAIENTREAEIDRMHLFLDELDVGHLAINSCIEIGTPSRRILAVAQQRRAELIVLGSHGRHGTELVTGTVADRIVRAADCPVLMIPEAMVGPA